MHYRRWQVNGDPAVTRSVTRGMPLLERLNYYTSNTGDCWTWAGGLNKDGYGRIQVGQSSAFAHRVSYELRVEAIPEDLVIDHLCRVRRCVNPSHMELVQRAENTMRGYGTGAKNARKTHCIRGHELTQDNIYVYLAASGNPSRTCKACTRIRNKKRVDANKFNPERIEEYA